MRRAFTITLVREHEQGARRYFAARVTCDGETLPVDDRDGSWIATLRDGTRRHVLPHVAEELQRRCYTATQRRVPARVRPSETPAGVPAPVQRQNGLQRLPAQLDMDGTAHEVAPAFERPRLFTPVATSRGQLSMGA